MSESDPESDPNPNPNPNPNSNPNPNPNPNPRPNPNPDQRGWMPRAADCSSSARCSPLSLASHAVNRAWSEAAT